jgi:PAS domain-containing protein
MGTLHNLTLRTATAVGRLAELQRRAERITTKPLSPVTKAALQELSVALEELQVANEALEAQVQELTAVRDDASHAVQAFDEFANAAPIAVLWTDRAGVIERGNETASALLNIGKHHLQGKPLMLFVTDRQTLFGALRSMVEASNAAAIDVEVTVRPRERRPRKMTLSGRRLEHDARCVWFLQDAVPSQEPVPAE